MLADIEDLVAQFRSGKPIPVEMNAAEVEYVCKGLLNWYTVNRRKLPWRGDAADESSGFETPPKSPYGTWVSEIMLQQTRVETVVPFWHRWMAKYPTVSALAAATPEEVNAMWAGLGYYRRAQALLNGARDVVARFGGEVPDAVDDLKSIKGIGPYTAGAIASIAYNKVEPLVDGNVVRVLSRLRAQKAEVGSTELDKACWKLCAQIVDPHHPGDFNQALMELGATVCTPRSPACSSCPISNVCLAHGLVIVGSHSETGTGGDLPASETYFPITKSKKAPRSVILSVSIFRRGGEAEPRYLFVRRPASGLLANQWEFPSCTVWEELPPAHKKCKVEQHDVEPPHDLSADVLWEPFPQLLGQLGYSWMEKSDSAACLLLPEQPPAVIGSIEHVFSHQRHTMHAVLRDVTVVNAAEDEETNDLMPPTHRWMTAAEIIDAGITSGCKKLLSAVLAKTEGRRATKAKSKRKS